jgi:hypothetical protein
MTQNLPPLIYLETTQDPGEHHIGELLQALRGELGQFLERSIENLVLLMRVVDRRI